MSTVNLGKKGKGQRMKIPGFWGRPRLNGKSAKLLKNSLERAENRGVETKR
jgi:multimeric flavodoxin WrbA